MDDLKSLVDKDFSFFDSSVVLSRSNLDFGKLRHNFEMLGFDLKPFQKFRIRIDKELVGWRHGVAHGNDPDLSSVDLEHHVKFAQDLLLLLADNFQENIVLKCSNKFNASVDHSTV